VAALLDIHTVFFTVLGYPMSYLEFFGTLLNVWAVWLMTNKRLATWPVGLVATVLFAYLFFQIRMYSDFLEQGYYFATNCWGWWLWTRKPSSGENAPLRVSFNSARTNAVLAAGIAGGTLALGWASSHLHVWLPAWFPEAASFAYLDAFTTAMSFVAQLLGAYQKMENWPLWMLVNLLSAWMYWQRGVLFVAVLFLAFFVLAVKGWLSWQKLRDPSLPAR